MVPVSPVLEESGEGEKVRYITYLGMSQDV